MARRLALPLLLVLAYLALRVPLAARMPTFFDEALYAAESYTALHDAGALFIGSSYARPPLHTWLGMLPLAIGVPPIASVRIVSLLAGLVTLAVVVALARRIGGRSTAIAAGVLYVIAPYFVVGDVVGVVDPVLTAAGMVALLFSIRLAEGRPRAAPVLGAALAIGLMTKLTALIAVALVPAALLFFDWSAPDRRARLVQWARGGAIALGFVAAAVVVNKLGARGISILQSESGLLVHRPLSDLLSDPLGGLRDVGHKMGAAFVGYMTVPVLALAALGAAAEWRRNRPMVVLLLAWAAAVVAAAFLAVYQPYPRYLMMGLPPLLVLAAHGAVVAARAVSVRVAGRRGWALGIALAAALCLPAAHLSAQVVANPADAPYPGHDRDQYVTGFASGLGWDGLAEALRQRSRPGTNVIMFDSIAPLQMAFHLGTPRIEHRHRGVAWREPLWVADGPHRWLFVRYSDPRARGADFMVRQTGATRIHDLPLRRYRVVASFTTLEGLATNQLLERRSLRSGQ